MGSEGAKLTEGWGGRVVARAGLLVAVQMAVLSGLGARAAAQCAEGWIPNGLPGIPSGFVAAMIVWDPDGDGPVSPQLVVAGHFTMFGNTSVNNIAAYDLEIGAISNLGGGITVSASNGPTVYGLAIGGSNELIAAGDFRRAGAATVNGICRWNGSNWQGYGNGIGVVNDVAVRPDGEVVVATRAVTLGAVLHWDGSAWPDFGPRMTSEAYSVGVMTNGDIVAGGRIGVPGSPGIARCDGAAWYGLGSGVDDEFVLALTTLAGGDLVVGGAFGNAGGFPVNSVARWDGAAWQPLGTGIRFVNGQAAWVRGVAPFSGGGVMVVGQFDYAGSAQTNNVARWDGTAWSALGSGVDDVAYAVVRLPNGDFALGGDFLNAGGGPAHHLARYRPMVNRADLNCDGMANNFHIDPFVLALTDPAVYAIAYPACDRRNADTNCDGLINDFDIDPFVSCIVGAGCR